MVTSVGKYVSLEGVREVERRVDDHAGDSYLNEEAFQVDVVSTARLLTNLDLRE